MRPAEHRQHRRLRRRCRLGRCTAAGGTCRSTRAGAYARTRTERGCQATIGALLVESVSPPPSALPPSRFCLLAWWPQWVALFGALWLSLSLWWLICQFPKGLQYDGKHTFIG